MDESDGKETANFTAEGIFDEMYFTRGRVYAGQRVRPDLKVWKVIDDLGMERIILPDTPSPHLITRTDNPDLPWPQNHQQACTGIFRFAA